MGDGSVGRTVNSKAACNTHRVTTFLQVCQMSDLCACMYMYTYTPMYAMQEDHLTHSTP